MTANAQGLGFVPDTVLVGLLMARSDLHVKAQRIERSRQVDDVSRCPPCDETGNDLQDANSVVAQ